MVVRCLQIPFQAFLGQVRFSQIHQPCLTPSGVGAEGMYIGLYANFLNFDVFNWCFDYLMFYWKLVSFAIETMSDFGCQHKLRNC